MDTKAHGLREFSGIDYRDRGFTITEVGLSTGYLAQMGQSLKVTDPALQTPPNFL